MIGEILEVAFNIGLIASPGGVIFGLTKIENRRRNRVFNAASDAENIVDGRTKSEWYELIKSMGKEEYERLSLAPLEGLERSTEYGWNVERLMGARNWNLLSSEWYPELHCKHCKDKYFTESKRCTCYGAHQEYRLAAEAERKKNILEAGFNGKYYSKGHLMINSEVDTANKISYYYEVDTTLGCIVVTARRGNVNASTKVLAQSFNDILPMTKKNLLNRIVAVEKELADQAAKQANKKKKEELDKMLIALDKTRRELDSLRLASYHGASKGKSSYSLDW